MASSLRSANKSNRAIENRETAHGVSIPLVPAELAAGPVLLLGRYSIEEGNSVADLQQKGQRLEHRMYPMVLQWLGENKLQIGKHGIEFEHQPLREPIEFCQ